MEFLLENILNLIGFLVGTMIKTTNDHQDNIQRMVVLGSLLIITGWLWSFGFPINKQLWTSSYVLYTAGIAIILLSGMIWMADIKKIDWWTKPFVILGSNAIFLYVLSSLWVKILLKISFELDGKIVSGYFYLYKTIFQPIAGNINGSLFFAISHVLMFLLILTWMHRKKIFIRI